MFNKVRNRILGILALLLAVFCIVWGVKSDIWSVKDTDFFTGSSGDEFWEDLNVNGETGRVKLRREFNYENSDDFLNSEYLIFVTHNKKVRVWANTGSGDQLIYEFGYAGKKYVGSDNGNAFHKVHLPHEKNFTVTVLLSYSYESSNLRFTEFVNRRRDNKNGSTKLFVGSYGQWLKNFVAKNLYQGIPTLLLVSEGVVFLILYFVALFQFKNRRQDFFGWAMFCIVAGVGFFLESHLSVLMGINSFVVYFLGTLMVSIIPFAFAWFTQKRNILIYADPVNNFMLKFQPIVIILVSVAAWIRIIPFAYVRAFVFGIFYIYAALILGSVVIEIRRVKGLLEIFEIPIIIVCTTILADRVLIIFSKINTDSLTCTRFGSAVFFVWTGIDYYIEYLKTGIIRAESRMLKRIRNNDFATGFKMGNVLWSASTKKMLENSIFTMIVTNITNIDEFSEHEQSVRDDAVQTFGRILSSVFLSDNIYRLPGAKFAILLYDYEINLTEMKLKVLTKRIQEVNQAGIACPIHWTSVSAVYDRELDLDLDGFYVRIMDKLHKAGIAATSFPGSIP